MDVVTDRLEVLEYYCRCAFRLAYARGLLQAGRFPAHNRVARLRAIATASGVRLADLRAFLSVDPDGNIVPASTGRQRDPRLFAQFAAGSAFGITSRRVRDILRSFCSP